MSNHPATPGIPEDPNGHGHLRNGIPLELPERESSTDGEQAVGGAIISRRTDLTLVEEEHSILDEVSGRHVESDEAVATSPPVRRLDALRVENARPNGLERDRSQNGVVDGETTQSPQAVPSSPITNRNSRLIQDMTPREKLLKVIARVRQDNLLAKLVERLRNPAIIGESLCTFCKDLNLRLDDFFVARRRTWRAREEQSFGQLRSIYLRSEKCRLCRLVINAFKEQLDLRKELYGTQHVIYETENLECFISWETDGTEVVTDKYGDSTEVPQTRCICVKWPRSEYKVAYLILAYPNTVLGPERDFLGRFQSSLDKTVPEKLKEWYDICCNNHEGCKSNIMDAELQAQADTLRAEPYFGVVDLDEMKVTALPVGAKYVALSYVWGDKNLRESKFKTTLEHVEDLMEKNGLKKYFDQLPLTIQDATRVVRSLGLRYLWVDALSIIQDDDEFWGLNATKMHLIYGNAEITIFAADGDGGNSGITAFAPLPGKYELHYKQHVEYIKEDLNLMVWNPFERYLERSKWSTRAWTFQEYELSRRKLVFVEGRAYLHCPTTTMSLDKYSEDTLNRTRQPPLEDYKRSVAEYTPRQLTHQKDVEVAFSGIGTILCKSLGGEQLFCLPTSHFDWALLWQPDTAPVRREPEAGEKYAFPSWSWCGWKSATIGYPASFTAGCELDVSDWLLKHTWISWYVRDQLGNLNIVWRSTAQAAYSGDASTSGYRAAKRLEDIDENGNAMYMSHDLYGRELSQRLLDQERGRFFKTMPRWPFNVRTNSHKHEPTAPPQRFLQFWTWSAQFSVVPEDVQKPLGGKFKDPGPGLKRFCILDGNSDFAGSIVLNENFVERRERLHEFIALSEARPFTQHECEVWNHWETSRKESSEWYLYHVMLLEYEDGKNLVARRVGIGKMYKRAFDRPVSSARVPAKGKVWKEIILG